MYPLLSITKPEPVAPPSADLASIETTEGSTRWAISATDPTGRSIVDVDFTRFTECPKSEPVEEAPNAPAITPTMMAKIIAERREIFLPKPRLLGATHQGPLGSMLMELFCYNLVASNKPSPVGMSELTQDSVSALIAFPASRRAIVLGSR
ncbi:unannotated protein [freshwater metagenome]|uniref:Unannotated protein n=1 Tax=freshwater metagenome TaxID=449393 RepID=A0A6J6WVR6_9ZZZZ